MWKSCTISKICLFTFILRFPQAIFAREEWRDPHDMHIKLHNHRDKTKSNPHECHCPDHNEKDNFCLTELIGKIVGTVNFRRDSETYEGELKIILNKEDYHFLETIHSGDKNFELRQFSKVVKNSIFMERNPVIFTIMEYMSFWLHNEYLWLAVGLVVILYLLWKVQPHKYTFKMLFKLFLPLVYISDFAMRYQALIEEDEINKFMHLQGYQKCDRNKLGWFEWLYDKVTDNCAKNHRNFLLSQRASMHIITPMKVLSQQFDILIPVFEYLGEGCGKFIYAVVVESPWYVKPFVAVFTFLIITIILLMMGARLFGISPKFNFLYLLNFDFRLDNHRITDDHQPQQKDSLSGENLKLFLKSKNQSNNTILLDTAGLSTTARVNAPISFKTKKRNKDTFRRKTCQPTNLPGVHVNNPSTSKQSQPDETASSSKTEGTSWPCWPGGDQANIINRRPMIEFD